MTRHSQDEAKIANQSAVLDALPSISLNAFQLMNSALDISAIFERRDDVVLRATRFTSKAAPPDILQHLESAIAKRGGTSRRRDDKRCGSKQARA